jgi:hypothetical protein
MADNLNQQNSSAAPPPEPEIAIRTMESDLKSIEQSGGQAPKPEVLEMKSELKPVAGIGIPGYTGPEQPIFSPTSPIPTSVEASQIQSEVSAKEGKSKVLKTIVIIAAVLAIVASFWFLGYYIIFPWLFSR